MSAFMKWITTPVSFFKKMLSRFGQKQKAKAKKYIVTNAGGRGDLTRMTHRFHLWVVPIRGNTSKVILCSQNPNCTVTYTLEELQTHVPADLYVELGRQLTETQRKRDTRDTGYYAKVS
jgi:hypothetical protein